MAKKNTNVLEPQLIPSEPLSPIWEGKMATTELPVTPYESEEPLRKSVATFGVLCPIVLCKDGNGHRIVDGKRRRDAAAHANVEQVPVVIYDLPRGVEDSALITANEQRSTNWLAEFDALLELLKVESNENSIANQLSLQLTRIRKLLTLRNLIQPLMGAWRDGLFSASAAFSAAKLSSESQKKLVDVLAEKGTFTASDIGTASGKEPKEKSLFLDENAPDRNTIRTRLKGAILNAGGNLDRFTPEILAEYLTDWVLGGESDLEEHGA